MSRRLGWVALVWLAGTVAAWAGGLTISPIRVDLPAGSTTVALRVTNGNAQPTVMQATVFAWKQEAGETVLLPTRAVLATPPVFRLQPNTTQVVRIGLLGVRDASRETAYRLILAEVPKKTKSAGATLDMVWRFSIPVFVAPREGVPTADLQWRLQQGAAGDWELRVHNAGTGHVALRSVQLTAGDATHVLTTVAKGHFYVLPGATLGWTLPPLPELRSGTRLMVRGQTDEGSFHEALGVN